MAPGKKRKHAKIEEISFDDDARQEYLTGFQKRKQARIKAAQEAAALKEKEEHLAQRREMRRERKAGIEKQVRKLTRQQRRANGEDISESESESGSGSDDDEDEWNGVSPSPPEKVDREDDYIDEDKYTTVTIEEVNVDREGLHTAAAAAADFEDDDGDGDKAKGKTAAEEDDESADKKKRVWTKEKPRREQPKPKKKKFRYETKAERQVTRKIQHARNSKQAKQRKARGKP